MNIFDRFLLAIYSLIVAVCSLIFILFCLDFITIAQIEYWFVLARFKLEVIIGVVLLLILSIRFFSISFSRVNSKDITIKIGNDPSSKITLKALINFIEKSADQITSLHSVQAKITILKGDVLKINLTAGVLPDTDVIKVSEQVKTKIQQDIQFTIGRQVDDIQIVFNTIGAKQPAAKG